MSIESEYQEVTGVKPRTKENRQKYLGRIVKAVEELDETDWEKLSEKAQTWFKPALKADESGEDIPDFPDAEPSSDAEEEENEEMPTAAADPKPKKSAKATTAKKSAKATNGEAKKQTRGNGYKGHREGSRKEKIHKIFDEKGADAAIKAAEKEGLASITARSWIYSWGGSLKPAEA